MATSQFESFVDAWAGTTLVIAGLILPVLSETAFDGPYWVVITGVTLVALGFTAVDLATTKFAVGRYIGRIGVLCFVITYTGIFLLRYFINNARIAWIAVIWAFSVLLVVGIAETVGGPSVTGS